MTMNRAAALRAEGYSVIDCQGNEFPNSNLSDTLLSTRMYPYQLRIDFNQYISPGVFTREIDDSECKEECGETMEDEICDIEPTPVKDFGMKDLDCDDLMCKAFAKKPTFKVPFKSEYKFFTDRYKLVDKDLPQTEK